MSLAMRVCSSSCDLISLSVQDQYNWSEVITCASDAATSFDDVVIAPINANVLNIAVIRDPDMDAVSDAGIELVTVVIKPNKA